LPFGEGRIGESNFQSARPAPGQVFGRGRNCRKRLWLSQVYEGYRFRRRTGARERDRNIRRLDKLGYRPNVPVTAEQLSNADNRHRWIKDKEMKVLQSWSDQHPETPLDLFIDVSFDFDAELAAATWKELRDVGVIPVVTLATLVKSKRAANREHDRIDLENLRLLYPEQINR
jgi:hypothetical protein